jgi:hypothetical protein
MTLELPERVRIRAGQPSEILHVTRSFFAEPTLSQELSQQTGVPVRVLEVPLVEALVRHYSPALVWASSASPAEVSLLRATFPQALLLVSIERSAAPTTAAAIIELYDRGADLVVADEGVRHAAAAATSLLRRRSQLTGNIQVGGSA